MLYDMNKRRKFFWKTCYAEEWYTHWNAQQFLCIFPSEIMQQRKYGTPRNLLALNKNQHFSVLTSEISSEPWGAALREEVLHTKNYGSAPGLPCPAPKCTLSFERNRRDRNLLCPSFLHPLPASSYRPSLKWLQRIPFACGPMISHADT